MNIQDVILGFIYEEPMSGYDIKQMMENSVSYFFDASFGAIYPALRKMEKEGLVEKQVIQQDGKPNKNLFVITESGKEQFQHYLNSPVNPTITRSDILIRIFFGRFTTNEKIQQWLEEEREKSQAMFDNLNKIADMYPEMEQHKRFTLEFGIRQAEMILGMVDEELKKLKQQQGEI
ncbi:PadR family transcriptional regulator [Neobacillus vireti]|uniref:Transcriptional regulator n=1 Tax=Neobacillus vireti LMG 21834 TaxID=1131730 RepID=A0AB94IIB0_9BACI|nr:PadR family transcriptional regulator [Neobacillus vireti]ETI66761.1 transcriptional regulator [Neobacillus vireti LMG 21834]KLT15344.1 transcriptional regulator [Neobacillus vireti]